MVSNTPKERAIPAVMESMIREWLTQTTEENRLQEVRWNRGPNLPP